MAPNVSAADLDAILALQLSIAWAGESAGERLGWWKSDLVDAEGGGDLFARLAPRTGAWSSLILVREAARRVDEVARENFAGRDAMASLFSFGFALDERLDDRLAYHRQSLVPPADVFGDALRTAAFDRAAFTAWLGSLGKPKVEIEPNGRRILAKGVVAKGGVSDPLGAARLLAATLAPLEKTYPFPYLEVT